MRRTSAAARHGERMRHRRSPIALAFVLMILAAHGSAEVRTDELLSLLDTDGDRRISKTEFQVNKVAVVFRNVREPGARLRFEDTQVSRAAFDSFDTDHDGVLTTREVVEAPFFRFETYDTDKDGSIDAQELEEFVATLRR